MAQLFWRVIMSVQFSCDGCGKSYSLKPEIAGRKVKCKCGMAMIAPSMPVVEEDVYDIVDDPPKAVVAPHKPVVSPSANVVQAQPVDSKSKPLSALPLAKTVSDATPVAQPARKPAKRNLEYRRGLTQKERVRNASPVEIGRDVIAPLVLLTIGLIVLIGVMAFGYGDGSTGAIAVSMIFIAVYALIKTVVMIGAAFVAAPLASVSFGPTFGTVMLKLAAVALAPEALYAIIDYFSNGLLGLSLSLAVVGVCYLVLFSQLFSLELDDSWLVTRIMIAARVALEFVLVGLLMAFGDRP